MAASKKPTSNRVKKRHAVPEKEKKPAPKLHAPAAPKMTATIDRREPTDRRAGDRRTQSVPVEAERRVTERRAKVNRRRQIDPTTCERDYSPEEVEFMSAMDAYKRRSGRMFPTCSEVLEVIKSLGYEKRPTQPETSATPTVETTVPAAGDLSAAN